MLNPFKGEATNYNYTNCTTTIFTTMKLIVFMYCETYAIRYISFSFIHHYYQQLYA